MTNGYYAFIFESSDYQISGSYTLIIQLNKDGYQTCNFQISIDVLNFTTSLLTVGTIPSTLYWNQTQSIAFNYTSILPIQQNIANAALFWTLDGVNFYQLGYDSGTNLYSFTWLANLTEGYYTFSVVGNATNYDFASALQFTIEILVQPTNLTSFINPINAIGTFIVKVVLGETVNVTLNYTNYLGQPVDGNLYVFYNGTEDFNIISLGDGLWQIDTPVD